jgi:hypothetical protein
LGADPIHDGYVMVEHADGEVASDIQG